MKSFFILPTAFAALSFLSGGLFLDGQEIDFEKQIAPIFAEHCAHCHGEDDQESGLRLDRRGQMLKGGDYGQPTIVPGKPEKSYLLEVVNHTDEGMEMPPDEDKIPAAEILDGVDAKQHLKGCRHFWREMKIMHCSEKKDELQ